MADPNDIRAIDQIRVRTNFDYRVEPVIALASDIHAAIAGLGDTRVRVAAELENLLDEFDDPDIEETSLEDVQDLDFTRR